LETIANGGRNFFYCHVSFSLGKYAMNASRLSKLSKDCLSGIGQGATVFATDFPIVNEI
jgi:hypothetical protein